jgi:large subunit ribosomal protein L29
VSTKRFKELKNLSKEELFSKIREIEAGLFQGRMKRAAGQLENTASLWVLRKDLARAKTLKTALERASVAKA